MGEEMPDDEICGLAAFERNHANAKTQIAQQAVIIGGLFAKVVADLQVASPLAFRATVDKSDHEVVQA